MVARVVQLDELQHLQRVLLIIFELPCEKYLAFKFIATEIIEDISFILSEKGSNGEYLLAETQKFIQFVIPGLSNTHTREASTRCFMKLCKHTHMFLAEQHTQEIINTVMPGTAKDWKDDESSHNILESLAILICSLVDKDAQKCTEYLKLVISKIFDPLMEHINWLLELKAKNNGVLKPEDMNQWVYDQCCEYINLVGEFCKSCSNLTDHNSIFDPIFTDIWGYIEQLLLQFSNLEKMQEAVTRLLKHSLRISPGLFQQHYLANFLRIVIS